MLITRVLVPYDFGDPSRRALAYAVKLAERFEASVDLLHVVPDPYTQNPYTPGTSNIERGFALPPGFLDEIVTDARARLEDAISSSEQEVLRATLAVRVGDVRAQILDYATAEPVDLIVIGTHGRVGAAHMVLGSVAERVVRSADCPVLTLR